MYIHIILYSIYSMIHIYIYMRKWKLLCHYLIQGLGSMSLPYSGFRVEGAGGGGLGGLALGKGRKQWTISAQLALRRVHI